MCCPRGLLALVQRGRDRGKSVDAAHHVRMKHAAEIRPRSSLLISEMRQIVTGRRMDDRRVGRPLGPRPGLPVARHGAEHEPRIDRRQRLVVEAEALHHARPEILDDDVRLFGEPVNGVDRGGLLQVERHAFLARIQLAEGGARAVAQRRPRAQHVAFERFDLHHVRAEVGEQPRAIGPGDGGREIQRLQSAESLVVERLRHLRLPHVFCARPRIGGPAARH